MSARCRYCGDPVSRTVGLCWECWRLAIIAGLGTAVIDWIIRWLTKGS